MGRPQPRPALAKAPSKEHPAAPATPSPTPAHQTQKTDVTVMFSCRLDPTLRKAIKGRAVEEERSIQAVVTDALTAYLNM